MDYIVVMALCGALGGLVGHAIDLWEEKKFGNEN